MDDSDLKSITNKIYKTAESMKNREGKELADSVIRLNDLNSMLNKSVDLLSLFLADITDRLNDIVNDCIDCGIGDYADNIIGVIDDISDYNSKYISH